ncbi:putative Calmodulin-binding family protein [Hibiscus syriacus]|uniref:Calmodulin-binding family protein n=1 Tax=Hibiscus syriacus TaxID=106335 RepID=A0A6A3A6C2_HIBSY|nr:putative Calmodulin-binding family protein [Hibiscus syriacus]
MGDNKSKKKWKLWRSSSEGFESSSSRGLKTHHVAASETSDSSFMADGALAAAMATIVRAQPKDFRAVKREWAAIRIQTAFRGLLARRALRALKAVVRIQAIFRGRQVRNQAAVTLRCMQALVRVQARVRAQCLIFSEEQAVHKLNDPTKDAEKGWCDSPGTLEEVRAKQQMRQEGVMKRERAMSYSVLKQQSRSYGNGSPNLRANKHPFPHKHHHQKLDWNWVDHWMATKPWESADASNQARVLARPPMVNQTSDSLSSPSSNSVYDESSTSTSSASVSPTALEDNPTKKPSYMKPTQSIKARTFRFSSSDNMRGHVVDSDDLKYFHEKMTTLSCEDTRSCADSNPSFNFSRELCRSRQDSPKKKSVVSR